MEETHVGEYKFSSCTLYMASIIIFSSIWGIALLGWKGASRKSRGLLFAGLAILILSTGIVGYGNYVTPTNRLPLIDSSPRLSEATNPAR